MDNSQVLNYNLTCSTDDGRIADWIARQLEIKIGREIISATGVVLHPSKSVRVLTIIRNPAECPPYRVLEMAMGLAKRFCVDILEGDIVGEIPFEVVLACAGYAMAVRRIEPSQIAYEDDSIRGSV